MRGTSHVSFIGSNLILDWLSQTHKLLLNLDKLTYAGNLENLRSREGNPCYHFVQGDLCNSALFNAVLAKHRPLAVLNFAAESHLDLPTHGA